VLVALGRSLSRWSRHEEAKARADIMEVMTLSGVPMVVIKSFHQRMSMNLQIPLMLETVVIVQLIAFSR
jgi:hypothetical protein